MTTRGKTPRWWPRRGVSAGLFREWWGRRAGGTRQRLRETRKKCQKTRPTPSDPETGLTRHLRAPDKAPPNRPGGYGESPAWRWLTHVKPVRGSDSWRSRSCSESSPGGHLGSHPEKLTVPWCVHQLSPLRPHLRLPPNPLPSLECHSLRGTAVARRSLTGRTRPSCPCSGSPECTGSDGGSHPASAGEAHVSTATHVSAVPARRGR